MVIQENYGQTYEQEFTDFLYKFNSLLSQVLNAEISCTSADFKEHISELVILGSVFGLQYGVNHRYRRCDSKYLSRTENNVNIINLHISFTNLINGLILIAKSIVECKKIFVCGNVSLDFSLSSFLHSDVWIPGTLTNSQFVLQKYPFGKTLLGSRGSVIKNSIPVSVIFSLSFKAYDVISREVLSVLNREIVFDVSRGRKKHGQITYIGLIDTNINSVEHTNILNICINCYSRYTKKLITSLLGTLLTHVTKSKSI